MFWRVVFPCSALLFRPFMPLTASLRCSITRLSSIACAGLVLLFCLIAMPANAEAPGTVSGTVPLHWVKRVYAWRYNPANEPTWLNKGEALAMIRAAAAEWEACGVALPYAGLSDKTPGVMDGENVIGWKEDGKAYSAWTTWRARRSGQALEADITLYANIYSIYRAKGIDARLELRKSIVHELGHVLGLPHSDQLGDAMLVKVRTRPEWRLPSGNDISRCRALYSE